MGGWAIDFDELKVYDVRMIIYRRADLGDLDDVSCFTDWWLSGRGKAKGVVGAVDDCFISPSQHRKYIEKYCTLICIDHWGIVGWAVLEPSRTLIHLLVAGDCRGRGIGKRMMQILSPKIVRSKLDQSSGNPIEFYESLGYRKVDSVKSRSRLDIDKICPSRNPNIDVLEYSG